MSIELISIIITSIVAPTLLWLLKKSDKKQDATNDNFNKIMDRQQATILELSRKIDVLEEGKANWHNVDAMQKENKADHKEIWTFFRNSNEKLGAKVAKLYGKLDMSNGD